MSYTSDIPISGDSLGGTRDRIRTNFQLIASVMAINHTAFNALGQGKHKFLQMPEQPGSIGQVGAPLPPTTAADEGGLYTKVGVNPAETNLVFRAESDGFEYQLTKTIAASTARFGPLSATAPNGWTFLPGGLILQWGSKTNPGTSGAVVFATANINFPTDIIQVQCQLYHASSANESVTIRQDSLPNTTGFQYRTTSSSANTILKWYALGY